MFNHVGPGSREKSECGDVLPFNDFTSGERNIGGFGSFIVEEWDSGHDLALSACI